VSNPTAFVHGNRSHQRDKAIYRQAMSIGVEIERLAEEIERFGSTAYVLTVSSNGRPHAVAVDVRLQGDQLVANVGSSTGANVAERPHISVLWPPYEVGGFSLIVDGDAEVSSDGSSPVLTLAPTKAVLHRPAPQGSPRSSDCVPLSPSAPGEP